MARIFDERHRFQIWLQIELAVAEGWAALGRIPQPDYKRMAAKAKFDMELFRRYESKVEHEVVAFVSAVGDSLGELSRYFHDGLTSSDVMDTAQSMQMQEAWAALIPPVESLVDKLSALAVKHKRTVMIGRTHGIHAEPITFGLKVLVWQQELGRGLERLKRACEETAVGKLSGAVGNYAHIPPQLEERALAKLGLRPEPVSNQIVQRDRHAAALTALALLGGTVERIAVEIRSLQRTEIAELAEPFLAGQKGSSSMPHKRNPILCERMSGIARMLRGYAHTAMENMPLWNERDISHSSAERVIIADAFTLADYMIQKMHFVIDGLGVNTKKMEENIGLTHGLVFSQRLLIALTKKGLTRDEAYRLVQEPAMKAFEESRHFYNLVKDSREIRKHLTLIELSDVFSVEPYLTHVDDIFKRVGLHGQAARDKRPAPKPATVGAKPKSADAEIDITALELPADRPVRRGRGRGRRPATAAKADVPALPSTKTPAPPAKRPQGDAARSDSPYSALKGWRSKPAGSQVMAPPPPKPEPEPPAPEPKAETAEVKTRRPRGHRGGKGRSSASHRKTTPKKETE